MMPLALASFCLKLQDNCVLKYLLWWHIEKFPPTLTAKKWGHLQTAVPYQKPCLFSSTDDDFSSLRNHEGKSFPNSKLCQLPALRQQLWTLPWEVPFQSVPGSAMPPFFLTCFRVLGSPEVIRIYRTCLCCQLQLRLSWGNHCQQLLVQGSNVKSVLTHHLFFEPQPHKYTGKPIEIDVNVHLPLFSNTIQKCLGMSY